MAVNLALILLNFDARETTAIHRHCKNVRTKAFAAADNALQV